jgi:peptidyl-prolyl cis-trans isomerase A (cyclophilin A)
VDRFHQLVKVGFFDDTAVFRVVRGFVAQFGIHGDPTVSRAWRDAEIPADDVKRSNVAGTLTFAMAGRPTSRTTQLFFNLVDNERLDEMGFAPVCEIVPPGLDVVHQLYSGYSEAASRQQGRIQDEGNAFLRSEFPDLDYVIEARVVGDGQNATR